MTTSEREDAGPARLADAVRDRRLQLDLRQSDVAASGGPSTETLRLIEGAKQGGFSARTLAQLDRALGWAHGAAEKILDGTVTEPDLDETRGQEAHDWAALAAEVRRRRELLRLPVDLSGSGGPAEMTVRKIESGEPGSIRPKTKTRLEHALQWHDGLVDRILDGTATEAELADVDEPAPTAAATPCACVVGSPAWVERELATERRINAIAQVFAGELQRLLALVEAARSPGGGP